MYKKTKHILHLAAILACAGVTVAPKEALSELRMSSLGIPDGTLKILGERIDNVRNLTLGQRSSTCDDTYIWDKLVRDIQSITKPTKSSDPRIALQISEAICQAEQKLVNVMIFTKGMKLVELLDNAIDGTDRTSITEEENKILQDLRDNLEKLDEVRKSLLNLRGTGQVLQRYNPVFIELAKLPHGLLSQCYCSESSIYQILKQLKSQVNKAIDNICSALYSGEHLSDADKEVLNTIKRNIEEIGDRLGELSYNRAFPFFRKEKTENETAMYNIRQFLVSTEREMYTLKDQLLLQIHDRDKINEQVKEIMSRFNAEFRKLEDLLLT